MMPANGGRSGTSSATAPYFFPSDETWNFAVRISDNAARLSAVPFYLYMQYGAVLYVDWGDGTADRLDCRSYGNLDSAASVHEYPGCGLWSISVSSPNWKNVLLSVCSGFASSDAAWNEKTRHILLWRKTLEWCGKLPRMGGTLRFRQCHPSSVCCGTAMDSSSLDFAFCGCSLLKSVSPNLFDEWKDARSFVRTFKGCLSLKEVPMSAFPNERGMPDLSKCFDNGFPSEEAET